MSDPITYINRQTGQEEVEEVFGETFLRLIYGDSWFSRLLGLPLLYALARTAPFARLYGWLKKLPYSAKEVPAFIQRYNVDASEFALPVEEMRSFNDFFIRELKPSSRPVVDGDPIASSPADGRFLVFPSLETCEGFYVKGQRFTLHELLQSPSLAERYRKGSMLIGRLCPTDYHRFHFPCKGRPSSQVPINGWLYSVNPWALKKNIHYLTENKRTYCLHEDTPFGTVLIMEIGATCVGSIHQTYSPGKRYEKGQEKGYFSFGGSATVILFEPQSISFDADLVENSARHIETLLKMGESIGVSLRN